MALNNYFNNLNKNKIRESFATIHSINRDGTVNIFFEGIFIPRVPSLTSRQGAVPVIVLPSGQIKLVE